MLLINRLFIYLFLFLHSNYAFSDDSMAMYNEGVSYLFGYGVKVDAKKACDYFEQAANDNHKLAQHSLGRCYRNGYGRKLDYTKARYWYLKAIEQDNSKARVSLVGLYLFDIEKFDSNEVVSLLEKAAADEPQYAYFLLGYVCHKRIKPNCTDKDALGYYIQAAYNANLLSPILLSYVYENGIYGVAKDIEKAKKWREDFEFARALAGEEGQTYESGVEYLKERGFID